MANRTSHLALGREGEQAAAVHLRLLGYRVYGCNVRLGRDEIDLVAYHPAERVMVFAEVKTRSVFDPDFPPELNLTPAKLRRMERAARAWVREKQYEGSYRLDALCIAGGSVVQHIKQLEVTTE